MLQDLELRHEVPEVLLGRLLGVPLHHEGSFELDSEILSIQKRHYNSYGFGLLGQLLEDFVAFLLIQ